jgi:uncharacterized protein YecA (UPF0149 family)
MNIDNGRIATWNEVLEMPTAEFSRYRPMAIPPTPKQAIRKRVGRNDPCPCGSGKKFKQCCLARTTP